MTIFDENLILETINMVRLHNFDIRTVTLAISLRDCFSENKTLLRSHNCHSGWQAD